MSDSLFSPSWYRVADLKPRLRSHTQVHRHHYRGQLWYVLQDHCSARYHRFTPAAYYLIGLMDGERTVQEIWDAANGHLGDEAPTQDETIELLGQLHGRDVLHCDVPPDSEELFRRYERDQHQKLKQRFVNPLYVRFPMIDPEKLLNSLLPLVRPLFSWFGGLIWLAVVAAGLVSAASHWPELSENLAERALSPRHLLLMALVYPVIKGLHELGHAFATKVWGGEVHEMGITLLVLLPVPYVDASAASAFSDKRKRILVSAAGMMVELFLASLALFVWLSAEPGTVRDAAFAVVFIGSVSTVLFNGNPLLRFDGYYMLADAIEIPNLGSRSNNFLGYLIQRYVFGVSEAQSPATQQSERVWFVTYGIAAFVYRLFIMFFIILFISGKFFVIGILLAEWAILTQIVLPVVKQTAFLFMSPQLRRRRFRALGISSLTIAMLAGAIFFVPVPFWTRVEGVVWLPEQSQVRAGIDGTIGQILATPDQRVIRGKPLFKSEDPFLHANVMVLESRLRESKARYDAARRSDRVQAEIIKKEISTIGAELERARDHIDKLVVQSPVDGIFIVPRAADLPGRFVRQGELLGYVADLWEANIRVVVSQADISLVRELTQSVEVRFSSRQGESVAALIEREVPAANFLLPSKAFGTAGGGRIPVDPLDERGTKALQKVFQLDIALIGGTAPRHLGERVHVRFDHGPKPLAHQWYRVGRQLFLGRFGV
jgi:putative peptide zinc metalloprotease protein